MTRLRETDERLVARYVDGCLDTEARAGLERRLLAEPALRAAVEEHRAVRSWFGERRSADERLRPRDGFTAGVLERVRRLPSREELLAEAGEEEAAVLETGRRLVVAAALLFGLSMLVWGGLLRKPDPPRLEAADTELIQALDTAMEAAAARHDPETRFR